MNEEYMLGYYSQKMADDGMACIWEDMEGKPVEVTFVCSPQNEVFPKNGLIFVSKVKQCIRGIARKPNSSFWSNLKASI